MTAWSWTLLVAGVVVYTAGVAGLVAVLMRGQVRYWRRRHGRVLQQTARLRIKVETCERFHTPPPPAGMEWASRLLDEVDRVLAGECADEVLARAMTPTARALYVRLPRKGRRPRCQR